VSRSLILALAAAAVAVATLAPGVASAKPQGPGPMGVSKSPPGPMGIIKPPMGVLGVIKKPKIPIDTIGGLLPQHHVLGVVLHPDHDHDGPHGWWWWHHHHEHPWIIEQGVPVAVTGPAVAVTGTGTVSPGPCNCLTKTYLNDGSVKFTDVCTRETAIATPDEVRAQR
jgi:hypothetical protein